MSDHDDIDYEKFTGYSSISDKKKDEKDYFDGKICGAITRKAKMCRQTPLENGRCKHHGGKSVGGIQSGTYKHGGYSKFLPKRLIDKFDEAENDADLLSLRSEVALLTTRIFDLLEDVDDTAGKMRIKDIQNTFKRYKGAVNSAYDHRKVESDLEDLIDQLVRDSRIWDDIAEMIDLKRKLVNAEQSRMKTMSQYVQTDDVMLLVTALMKIVTDAIEDLDGTLMDREMIKTTIEHIAKEFVKLSNKQ